MKTELLHLKSSAMNDDPYYFPRVSKNCVSLAVARTVAYVVSFLRVPGSVIPMRSLLIPKTNCCSSNNVSRVRFGCRYSKSRMKRSENVQAMNCLASLALSHRFKLQTTYVLKQPTTTRVCRASSVSHSFEVIHPLNRDNQPQLAQPHRARSRSRFCSSRKLKTPSFLTQPSLVCTIS